MSNEPIQPRHAQVVPKPAHSWTKPVTIALVVVIAILAGVLIFLVNQPKSEPVVQTESAVTLPVSDQSADAIETSNQAENTNAPVAAVPTQSAAMQVAQQSVYDLVADYGDSVSVTVMPLDGSLGFSVNGDESFVSASMIKLLILAEYLDEVDAGAIDPDEAYTLSSSDIVAGTGRMQADGAGSVYTYDEMAHYMIAYSDNVATNVLISRMGMDAINAQADELGLTATDLERKMMDLNSGRENHISSNDAAKILVGIVTHTIASDSCCEMAEGFLLDQTDTLGIIEGLPDGVPFGHKTGDLNSLRHDGGIVYADYPYVVVVLTDMGAQRGNALMKSVSTVIYNALK